MDNIILESDKRFQKILKLEKIDDQINEESPEYLAFLKKFKDIFINIENKLKELTQLNISSYIFQIKDPLTIENINFLSYYFNKLKYDGEIFMDYRNNDKYYKRDLNTRYCSIKLIWEIKIQEVTFNELENNYNIIDDNVISDLNIILKKPLLTNLSYLSYV